MSKTTHTVRAAEVRKYSHPECPGIQKYSLLVSVVDLPDGIRNDPNARDATGLNRKVYREIKANLQGEDAPLGIFDLMNRGIVILAESVKLRDKAKGLWELEIHDGQGILDGGHTYKLITEGNAARSNRENQYVELLVRTGVERDLRPYLSRGLNSSVSVARESLDNLAEKYDWLKGLVKGKPYFDDISWKESDSGKFDVRDLLSAMEVMNIFDFPNGDGRHPISAYEKWSTPSKKFSEDQDENRKSPKRSKYFRCSPVLIDALHLYDVIRREFPIIYNKEDVGRAGKLDIVEQARKANFLFPFSGAEPAELRLTKGAAFPLFAAFRNCIELDPEAVSPKTASLCWKGGFASVLELWSEVAPELCRITRDATKDIGHKPDMLGKNRGHWANLHRAVEVFQLRKELKLQKGM